MRSLIDNVIVGAAAGAAGATALNATTYLDMVVRARPASNSPEKSVRKLSERFGISIPGDADEQRNRVAALGPLLGIGAGVTAGIALGVARAGGWRPNAFTSALVAAGAALVAGNAPMTLLGVTNPRRWSTSDWVSDLVPHLMFGLAASAVLRSRR